MLVFYCEKYQNINAYSPHWETEPLKVQYVRSLQKRQKINNKVTNKRNNTFDFMTSACCVVEKAK